MPNCFPQHVIIAAVRCDVKELQDLSHGTAALHGIPELFFGVLSQLHTLERSIAKESVET